MKKHFDTVGVTLPDGGKDRGNSMLINSINVATLNIEVLWVLPCLSIASTLHAYQPHPYYYPKNKEILWVIPWVPIKHIHTDILKKVRYYG